MNYTPARDDTTRGERLDSWKEIAAYLKRDIRTVQRWEKQEALPVHRHVHDERGTRTHTRARSISGCVWARSGRELFYRRGDAIMAVPLTPGEPFTSGTPRPLFEVPFYERDPGSPNYDVAADDQRFIMVLPATTGGPQRLNIIQGWKAEVLRRLSNNR